MFNTCIPHLYKFDAFLFKNIMLSQDLMLGGREFHNEVDVEAKVFPPSVALLLLGHRSVM